MNLQTTVVGCGAVAQRLYRKPLQQLEKRGIIRVAGLVDPVDEHANVLGTFFPKAIKYRQLDEALAASTPDFTVILSPAHLHCDQAIKALMHNSHVLCEKPMANHAIECARMNAVAAETKRILAIGMIRRFFPAFAHLRQIVMDGRLGAVRSFEYSEGHKFEWQVTTPAAFRPRELGGTGVLFDIGPHVIDYLAWTFGDLRISAYSDDALAGIESNASLEVTSLACPGSINLSWNSPQANELRVLGSKGEAVLRVDQFDQLALRRASGYEPQRISVGFPADISPSPKAYISPRSYPEAIYCQLVQAARAITLGESPAVDGEAGGRAIASLESALSLARPLVMPWLDVSEQNAFARLHGINNR
jgi:predicted dehydrogenase